jgi:queuine/archaeosine tRNA-ribosyltransferase
VSIYLLIDIFEYDYLLCSAYTIYLHENVDIIQVLMPLDKFMKTDKQIILVPTYVRILKYQRAKCVGSTEITNGKTH